MKHVGILCCPLLLLLLASRPVFASGFGVFTQGASGLGQANAVVARPTGPSSLYFNPALLNDVPGRQVEVGTTGVYADRKIKLDSGGTENGENAWNFPSTFYYTHQASDSVTAGLGIFFPFGLSTEWDDDYAGRYLGTSVDLFTTNINPAVSFRINNHLSVAAGFDLLYLDATLKSKVPQGLILYDPTVNDISQKFEGDGWGTGYNLGALVKPTDRISIGATYRSHIDVDVEGKATFDGVDPLLAPAFPNTSGNTDICLPAQATAGIAVQVLDNLVVEAGVRWEDWDFTGDLKIEFDQPVLGQTTNVTPRDWKDTWSYNIGGHYQLNDTVAINAGYLYGQNAVPDATFEPLIPDTDAHLFTVGTDLTFGRWTVSGAFGYEHHEDRSKKANEPDPLGLANGEYQADIYLAGLSAGYKF
jgi:long-chain fatty acid transport protein